MIYQNTELDKLPDALELRRILNIFQDKSSFGTMAEIGAAWITKADHKIINVSDFRPEKPLNDTVTWQTSIVDEDGKVSMTKLNADLFCAKIESLCTKLGYTPKDRETNMTRLISSIKIVK